MAAIITCPKCASDDVRFSEKHSRYDCKDCGHEFVPERPISSKRVFISYGHDEHTSLAERLNRDLKARGHQTWFDKDRLKPGDDWAGYIEDGFKWLAEDKANSVMVLLLTPFSARRPKGFCLREIHYAQMKDVDIIPLMVVDCELPIEIVHLLRLDMTECIPISEKETVYRPSLARLLEAIEEKKFAYPGPQQRLKRYLPLLEFHADLKLHRERFIGRQWVFDKIDAWLKENPPKQRVFWIIGSPGVGKTALSAMLSSRYLEVAALHLCKSGHTQKSDPGRVVTSIIYQLTTQLPDYEARLAHMDVERLSQDDATTMFDNLLVQQLSKLNQPNRPIIILIDALDEATSGGDNELANFIAAEFRKTPPWLRLVITSRRESAVTGPLQGLNPFILDTEIEANLADIRNYLRRELASYLLSRPDADRLVEQILEKSQGVFLYVERFCDDVQQGHLSLDRPEEFPQGLAGSFHQDFRRQFPGFPGVKEFCKDVRPALGAILAAREPLPVEILKRHFNCKDEELGDFTRSLGSLFPVTKEGGKEVIKPHHKALADWLTNDPNTNKYYVSNDEGHKLLAGLGSELYRLGVMSLPNYLLRNLPAHLLGCQRHEDAAALLTDPCYLEAKIEAGLVFEVAGDIAAVFRELPEGDYRGRLLAMLEAQGRSENTAMARMTIRSLVAIAEHDPVGVSKVVVTMVERPARGRGVAVAQANMQAARVALEVAVAACRLAPMAEAVRHVMLVACASADSNVRSLAIVAVFRLMHNNANYALGLAILRELARLSVWLGLVQPRRIEVFVCCALGLFFERHNDKNTVQDLKEMARGVMARIRGLKLALWLAPKVITFLLNSVSSKEAGNPHNVAEVKAYKKFSAAHPERAEGVREMIDFIDPAYGSSEEFLRALSRFHRMPWPRDAWYDMYPCSCALISRTLADDEAALEANYESWKSLQSDHLFRQDFMYRMRLIQIGRTLQEKPPLESKWTDRIELAIRDFMCEQRGLGHGSQNAYPLLGMMHGMVFMAHQLGRGHVPLLEELINWASTGQREEMLRWPEAQRNRQPDMMMMRFLEVMGAEMGANDPLSRETALFGISCFLKYASKFDKSIWELLATILTRMSHYNPDAVADFLKGIPSVHSEELTVWMNKVLPQEGVSAVIGTPVSDAFFASVFCEPPGKEDGLRREWQNFLRTLAGPDSVSATLRCGAQQVLQAVRSDSAGPSK